MINRAEADDKVGAGWLRAWMAFEVLASTSEVASSSMEELIGKVGDEEKVEVYDSEFGEVKRIENPPIKGVKEAYSRIAKVELVAKNLNVLLELVIKYGPSALEILEPKRIELPANDAQGMLNRVAEMMHVFAAAGIGGLIFTRKQ